MPDKLNLNNSIAISKYNNLNDFNICNLLQYSFFKKNYFFLSGVTLMITREDQTLAINSLSPHWKVSQKAVFPN